MASRIGTYLRDFAVALVLVVAVSSAIHATGSNKDKFDGPTLWSAAVEEIAENHINLADPAKHDAFVAQWAHKHDTDGVLKDEAKTDAAIEEMLHSLGLRFDYFFNVKDTAEEKQEVAGDAGVLGIEMDLVQRAPTPAEAAKEPEKLPPLSEEDKQQIRDFFRELKAHPEEANRITENSAIIIGHVDYDAAAAGKLFADDEILAVDHKPVAGQLFDDVNDWIGGAPGTTVTLTVSRKVDGKPVALDVSIERQRKKTVHTRDLGNGVAYIKLDDFMSEKAPEDLKAALTEAAKGKGIIFDLRGNPGGELNKALDYVSYFIADGTLLVMRERDGGKFTETTTMISPKVKTVETAEDGSDQYDVDVHPRAPLLVPADMPVIVLVNSDAASASEIFTGNMRFHHRAVIIGEHADDDVSKVAATHGKGVGQTVISLPYGRELHVTTFQFLPAGVEMDYVGVMADIQVEASDDKDAALEAALTAIAPMIADEDAHIQRHKELEHDRLDAEDKRRANRK